jgi:hypothetical protein
MWLQLPREVWDHVLRFLDGEDLCNVLAAFPDMLNTLGWTRYPLHDVDQQRQPGTLDTLCLDIAARASVAAAVTYLDVSNSYGIATSALLELIHACQNVHTLRVVYSGVETEQLFHVIRAHRCLRKLQMGISFEEMCSCSYWNNLRLPSAVEMALETLFVVFYLPTDSIERLESMEPLWKDREPIAFAERCKSLKVLHLHRDDLFCFCRGRHVSFPPLSAWPKLAECYATNNAILRCGWAAGYRPSCPIGPCSVEILLPYTYIQDRSKKLF